jgi:DNA polymerase
MSELSDFKLQWINCTRCALANEGRSKVIFSDGPEDARIMIVGESPGAVEDQQGIPFSGPAGKLLNELLIEAGFKRSDFYITNSVHCKPLNNHKPSVVELRACKTMLDKEIECVRPNVILLLGAVASLQVCGISSSMSSTRGLWMEYKGVPAISTYHPAAVLHTRDLDPAKSKMYRDHIVQDLKTVKEKLISVTPQNGDTSF